MTAATLAELAAVVGGSASDEGEAPVVVTGPAFLDSRHPEPGGLFVAIAGAHADGHDFAADAVAGGAAAVLGSRPTGVPTVVVADVPAALAALATHRRRQLPQLTALGVTGSQGKTSTKDLLAAVLADAAPTVATRGSFNNELGLPLTVLRADEHTRFLLLEMGARGRGHIAWLCAIAAPQVAVELNVGKAHLGEFGSQDDIAVAKGELVEALPADGTAVLNRDDPRVWGMRSRTSARVVSFGTSEEADVRLTGVALDQAGRPSYTLTAGGRSVTGRLQLVGDHQAVNAAAAAAAALAVGIPLDAAVASLAEVATLSRWRMEVTERPDGVTVVNDAYNANPDSVAAALRALVALARREAGRPRRTIAVLGEMLELGPSSPAEHREVGRLAAALGVRRVVAVGEAAREVLAGAQEAGAGSQEDAGEEPVAVADNTEAAAWLRAALEPGDVVLLKASRGARLDEVAAALLEDGPRADAPEPVT